MTVTLSLSLHSYAISFANHCSRIIISPKFDKDQIVQESWKGQGRVMDRWVNELIDRWAHNVHFHDPLSKLWLGLERHSEAVQTVFNILYPQTISSYIVNLFHEKITNGYLQRTGQVMRF